MPHSGNNFSTIFTFNYFQIIHKSFHISEIFLVQKSCRCVTNLVQSSFYQSLHCSHTCQSSRSLSIAFRLQGKYCRIGKTCLYCLVVHKLARLGTIFILPLFLNSSQVLFDCLYCSIFTCFDGLKRLDTILINFIVKMFTSTLHRLAKIICKSLPHQDALYSVSRCNCTIQQEKGLLESRSSLQVQAQYLRRRPLKANAVIIEGCVPLGQQKGDYLYGVKLMNGRQMLVDLTRGNKDKYDMSQMIVGIGYEHMIGVV